MSTRAVRGARRGVRRRVGWSVGVVVLLATVGLAMVGFAVHRASAGTSGAKSDPSARATIFADQDRPAVAAATDPGAAELGVRLRVGRDGTITAVRFFKGAGNTGTHTASFWTADGRRLATATFTGETVDGWQTARLTPPVPVVPGVTYVASYHTEHGHYAYDHDYFAGRGTVGGPDIFAPAAEAAHNGVYTYGASAFPSHSFRSSNYWVDAVFTPATTVPSPVPSPSSVPSASGSPAPPPVPTPTPGSGTPPQVPPPVGSYVRPQTVGYTGSDGALVRYPHGGAAPAGCTWVSYGLRCDQTDLTLDHVHIVGSLYWTGAGSLTITNSVVDGGDAWYVVYAAATSPAPGARITVSDSTLRWTGPPYPSGYDVGPLWSRGDQPQFVRRCDLSGMPQGLNPSGGSVIEDNWIHGLVQNNPPSNPTHLDAIFSQGGSDILIQGNYIDAPVHGDVTAALFLQDRSGTDHGVRVYANFLRGGPYFTLRNETSLGLDVRNNTFGGPNNGLNTAPGTIGTWSGNVHDDGSPVPRP